MRNYKLKTYVKKGLVYSLLSNIEGVPEYNGKSIVIDDLTFDTVKRVMKALGDITTWEKIKDIFSLCFNVYKDIDKWFWNGKVKEFFQARNYIIKEFNRLIEQEQKLLRSVQSVDSILWQQSGGNKLNRFGGVLSLNQLGKLYGVYPFDLKDRKYIEILVLLTIEKETGEIQDNYNKIKSQVKK